MESANIYLTLVIIGITIIAVKKLEFLNLNQEVEHFGNPIALIKKIAMGIVNFFVALLDILLVIADVFAAIPVLFFVIMDIIMIIFTWLWPISMIKGVVQSIFTITKILLLLIFDIVSHILRQIFKKLFGLLKGGLWGLPHTPEQHRSHIQLDAGFDVQFGDHHHHEGGSISGSHDGFEGDHAAPPEGIYDPDNENFKSHRGNHRYRPLRCYKGIGSNGYINIISTIICPPLGVFMAFGIKGWFKIIVCSLLSLLYYIPGLVYALLITSHLGLGRKITAKDCGGLVNMGLRLAGCTSIKTETDCKGATIPGWRDANGDRIPSCYFVKDDNEPFGGKCYNIIYPSAIHTTGSTYRYASEVGGKSDGQHTTSDKFIHHTRELAGDARIGGNDDLHHMPIDYDAKGNARHEQVKQEPNDFPEPGPDSTGPNQALPIQPGPWKYTGGD